MTVIDGNAPGQLRWRCRRGTRELDALLTWYLDARHAAASEQHRQGFARLLEAEDPDVWDWCMGRSTPADAVVAAVVDEIRAHHCV